MKWVGSDGNFHTGPSGSPENSYRLSSYRSSKKYGKSFPYARDHVRIVAHSPSIDIAVLRQICNVYSVMLSWVALEQESRVFQRYLNSPEYATDKALSILLTEKVKRFPNRAIPSISLYLTRNESYEAIIDEFQKHPLTPNKTNTIKEYKYAHSPKSDWSVSLSLLWE